MDRVERAAHDPDGLRGAHRAAVSVARPRARPPIRARPAPIRTVSPARIPTSGAPRRPPEALEVALEALGGLLDLEVGLRREPLDPLAGDPVRAVRLAVTLTPVGSASSRWTTTPDGSGGASSSSQTAGARRAPLGSDRSLPGRRGDRDAPQLVLQARGTEGRPGLGRGRQVDLVEGDEHRLLEQRRGSWALSSSRITSKSHSGSRPRRRRRGPAPASARRGAGRRARARPRARALDEPGHVGDRRPSEIACPSTLSARSITPRFGSRVVNG